MISAVRKKAVCPDCGRECRRHSKRTRYITTTRGREKMVCSVHYCGFCRKYFTYRSPLARHRVKYGEDVIEIIRNHSGTLQQIELHLLDKFNIHVPTTTIHDLKVMEMHMKNKNEKVFRFAEKRITAVVRESDDEEEGDYRLVLATCVCGIDYEIKYSFYEKEKAEAALEELKRDDVEGIFDDYIIKAEEV